MVLEGGATHVLRSKDHRFIIASGNNQDVIASNSGFNHYRVN